MYEDSSFNSTIDPRLLAYDAGILSSYDFQFEEQTVRSHCVEVKQWEQTTSQDAQEQSVSSSDEEDYGSAYEIIQAPHYSLGPSPSEIYEYHYAARTVQDQSNFDVSEPILERREIPCLEPDNAETQNLIDTAPAVVQATSKSQPSVRQDNKLCIPGGKRRWVHSQLKRIHPTSATVELLVQKATQEFPDLFRTPMSANTIRGFQDCLSIGKASNHYVIVGWSRSQAGKRGKGAAL